MMYNRHSLRSLTELHRRDLTAVVLMHWMMIRHIEINTFRLLQKFANQPSSGPSKKAHSEALCSMTAMLMIRVSEFECSRIFLPVCGKRNQQKPSLRAKMSSRITNISPVNCVTDKAVSVEQCMHITPSNCNNCPIHLGCFGNMGLWRLQKMREAIGDNNFSLQVLLPI